MKPEKLDFYRSKLAEIEGKEDSFVIFTDTVTKKFIQFASGKKGGFYADVFAKKLTEKELDKSERLLGFEKNPLELHTDVLTKLTEIPGLSDEKARFISPHLNQPFGKFKSIPRVSKSDLQKVAGIGERLSKKIIDFIPELEKHILKAQSKKIAEKDYSFGKECTLEEAADLTRRFFEEVCNLPEDHDISVELETGEVKCALCGKTFKERETKHLKISVDKARELGISEESIQKSIDEEVRFAKAQETENEEIKLELDDLKKIVHERGTIFITVCSNCSNIHNLK